ncbi:hypothetical protein BST61_g5616 [Cercospora zeina]
MVSARLASDEALKSIYETRAHSDLTVRYGSHVLKLINLSYYLGLHSSGALLQKKRDVQVMSQQRSRAAIMTSTLAKDDPNAMKSLHACAEFWLCSSLWLTTHFVSGDREAASTTFPCHSS